MDRSAIAPSIEAVAERVESLLGSSPITAAYTASLTEALTLPGNILSETPDVRWARTLWTCCAAAGGCWEQAVPAAAAVELFMVALDVLDDEEDNEHTQLKAKLGPARALNVSTGLLLLAQECLLDSPGGAKSARMLLDAGLRACSGQDADLAAVGSHPGGLDRALAITAGKSASLTTVVCRLGAFSASADEAVQELYARFGWLLGMAAQLSNDLAALHTDATGKTDIALRRPTLPLIYAALQGSIQARSSEDDARAALWAGGAVYLTWAVAEAYRRHALRLILQLTGDPLHRDELAGLVPALS